uniref:Uncharacterized protein n=1 Tax=Oryzias latipes TaxID=8090 RepID=A0A3P9LDI1_ORYLA
SGLTHSKFTLNLLSGTGPTEMMALYRVINENGLVEDVRIGFEGLIVLRQLGDISKACCYRLRLTNALDLKRLRYTFKVFQKVLVEVDSAILSTKVQRLKNIGVMVAIFLKPKLIFFEVF